MNQLMEKFKAYLLETDHSLNSVSSYSTDLKKFIKWFLASHETFSPDLITPIDIVDYRGYLQRSGGRPKNGKPAPASPATVNRALISLRIFFKWAVTNNLTSHDPMLTIKYVREEQLAPKWLDKNEQNRLIRVIKNKRDLAIVNLMLHAGLRVSEVCNLNYEDLTIHERSGQVIVRSGKGNKQRLVPLNVTVRNYLNDYLESNLDTGKLFKSQRGSITPRGIQHMLQKYAYQAKLEVSPHTLRHSFCKNLIDRGEPIDIVATLAGHKSMDVTRRYITPGLHDLQQAVDKIAWE